MHKVFISYHHDRDQGHKGCLVELGENNLWEDLLIQKIFRKIE